MKHTFSECLYRDRGWADSTFRILGLSLALCTAANVRAALPLPTGATAAPNAAATAAAFPKRMTARDSNYAVWNGGMVAPNYGRAGYYSTPSVNGQNHTGIGGLLEFDSAGNTTTRISPVQLGVTILPAADASQFFAEQITPTELTFGLYAKAGGAPIFQRKLTTDPARTSAIPGSTQNRVFVVRDLDATVEVLAFNNDGSLAWGRSLTGAGFAPTTPNTTPIVFGLPLADGSLLVHVLRMQFNLTTFSVGYETTIIKLTSAGAVEWSKRSNANAIFVAIPSATTSNLYFTGAELSLTGTVGTIVAKATAAGGVLWSKRITGGSGGQLATVAAAGELANEKVLLTGATANAQGGTNPATSAILGVMSSSGAIEAQTQVSFGTINIAAPQFEGNRIWIGLTSRGAATDVVGPVYAGLSDLTLSNIKWKKYKNNMSTAAVSPDYDSDDVVASFFNDPDHAIEAVAFKDDFGASVSTELFTDATPTVSNPGLVATDFAFTLTDVTVTATSINPALVTGSTLTFETLPTTETSIGSGGGGPVTPVTIATQPVAQTVNQGASASFSVGINNPSGLGVAYQWFFNGTPIAGGTGSTYTISSAQSSNVGSYTVSVTSNGSTLTSSAATLTVNAVTPVSIATHPNSLSVIQGSGAAFSATINNPSSLSVSYQWNLNGVAIPGATSASYSIPSVQPANVGVYTLSVTSNGSTVVTNSAMLSMTATQRPAGTAILHTPNIVHPATGNVYDQFLLTGPAASITADPGQIARISYVDLTDDIVQLEFSGAGTLTVTLTNPSGPAIAVNYNQPTVSYMKGHATVTITGADSTTNFGVYSVGAATGNVLVLKQGVTYDGFADLALVNIISPTGQFAGVRVGNVSFFGTSGNVGLYAPGVNFAGPLNLYDIDARDNAYPKLLTGTVGTNILITGGNLFQTNGRAIEIGGATAIKMNPGQRSDGFLMSAQANQGRLERNGVDVTSSVIIPPAP